MRQLCNTVVTSLVCIEALFLDAQCRVRTEGIGLTLLHDKIKGYGNFHRALLEQGE